MRDYGLGITPFRPFRDFEGLPDPQRWRGLERAGRKDNVMQEPGADLVPVCWSRQFRTSRFRRAERVVPHSRAEAFERLHGDAAAPGFYRPLTS